MRGVRFGEIDSPVAQRLHLAATEHDAGLVALGDDVVERRGAILRDELLRLGPSLVHGGEMVTRLTIHRSSGIGPAQLRRRRVRLLGLARPGA